MWTDGKLILKTSVQFLFISSSVRNRIVFLGKSAVISE